MTTSVQTTSPLAALCRYYLACLARDVDRDLSEFASSTRGSVAYAELSELPVLPGSSNKLWEEPQVRAILNRFRSERNSLAIYVGYPVRLVHIRARSGWTGFRVEPVLAFELTFERTDSYPSLIDTRPEVNLKVLRSLMGAGQIEMLDESLAFQAEIGIDNEIVEADELDEIFSRIPRVRPEWPWQENPDPYDLSRDLPLSVIETEGIYNKAILLTSERSRYTRGLENELAELARKPETDYSATALGQWIHEPSDAVVRSPQRGKFIELLELNTEQRTAVRRAMTYPLTVVTGPPGTGKSQVVASIVANCAWWGEKVLVASKTHKAVDVVEERVNSFGPRPLLLRLGSNEYQARLSEYLSSLLSAASEPEDEASYRYALAEYQRQFGDRERSLEELNRIIDLRNRVDDLEQRTESIRRQIGEEVFANMRHLNLDTCRGLVQNAVHHALKASREKQGTVLRMLWPLLRSKRIAMAVEAARKVTWLSEPLLLDDVPLDSEDGIPMLKVLEAMERRLGLAPDIQEYFVALDELNDQSSTAEVTRSLMDIGLKLRSACDVLWRNWLKLQPSRLTPSRRRLLGDYKSLLDMRISADELGERMGSQPFRRFMQMFPEISNLFPAWAVTNLSARGRLPFEPGLFDLLIIDEASQCDIASALPLLYRSKRAVIIGDPKQLRHISQIPILVDHQLFEVNQVEELGERWRYTSMSLYDLAASVSDGNIVDLRDHHRSAAQIIGFSNEYFYENRLRVATKNDKLRFPYPGAPPVSWVDIKGHVQRPSSGSAFNRDEAIAVIQELRKLLLDGHYDGSVGVVTPFRSQANLIRQMLHENDQLLNCIGTSDLLVDTVYRFQGDERDVMVFSPVVSNNTPRSTLGFLRSNPNTFNVAVTRARAALVVVGDLSACMTCGVSHLEAFAQYAVTELEDRELRRSHEVPDLGPEYPPVANPEQVSEWERVFYRALYRRGLRPIPQYSVEQYILDFALFDGDRMLNIEVDGEYYHRSWTGELARRDQIRNGRLIELDWDVIRFWVYQIRDDLDLCVERVVDWHETPTDDGKPSPIYQM